MKQFVLLLTLSFLIFSCGDDEGFSTDDLTMTIAGQYNGDYEESDSGATFSTDDVDATISKNSNNKINITVSVIPGLAVLNMVGEMASETEFAIPTFTFGDDKLSGSGKLENDVDLTIDLVNDADANKTVTYTAIKN